MRMGSYSTEVTFPPLFQGRSDGGVYRYIYPQISLPYKFLCGYWLFFDIVPVCALAKLAVKIYTTPQMKFLATPLLYSTVTLVPPMSTMDVWHGIT